MRTLLITDDHPSVLRSLEFVFTGPELGVAVAESATAALAIAQSDLLDAALVDLHMPGMDGITLTRALKEHAASLGRSLPVWVMTAAPTVAAVEQARLAGAESLLKKPFDCGAFRDELLQRLNTPVPPSSADFAA